MAVRIEFSASSSKAQLKEVLNAVCAILNSCEDGGTLILFSESQPYSQKNADEITKKIEQTFAKTFGVEGLCKMFDKIAPTEGEENCTELRYEIKPTAKLPTSLYTINYNIYCASDAQVLQKASHEPIQDVVNFIKGESKQKKKAVLGEHKKEFSHGAKVALEEGKQVQLKQLEDGTSTKNDLATRMINESNKLAHYISAFANGSGGHIYFGIQTDQSGSYVVNGQTVHDTDKDKIINKVKESVDKLFVWPDKKECLKKGHDWDIYFVKVSNTEEPKYVIVISVNSHERGVFLKEPESYHIVDGNVEKMKFGEWMERALLVDYENIFSREKFPRGIGRSAWSSQEALENHVKVLEKLVLLRNDGKGSKFVEYKNKVSMTSDKYTICLIQQQEAANSFRQRRLGEAESKLKENEDFLNKATPAEFQDVGIYRVRMLYWMGVVKRAQGDYGQCRALCDGALQASRCLPNILVIPWIHYNKAKVLEIDIAKQSDSTKERELRKKCIRSYESALRSSIALSGFPKKLVADLQQRVLISMARLYLAAFFNGRKVIHKVCSTDDLKHADYLQGVVDSSVKQRGLLMTKLGNAEYQLICAERFYRCWEEFSDPGFLDKALKESEEARKTANDKEFKDVDEFAKGQIQVLQELGISPDE